jgi:hypothetical protein
MDSKHNGPILLNEHRFIIGILENVVIRNSIDWLSGKVRIDQTASMQSFALISL